jgi:LEA14-like dessication related protein
MNRFQMTAAIGCLAVCMLAGCAAVTKRLEPPRISLANIRVQEVTGLETVFEIQLRVFNTNDVDLNVSGIEAALEVNGQAFATGVSNNAVKIPSFGTELVTITVYSSVIHMVRSVVGLGEAEELNYRLQGKVKASGNHILPVILPFDSAGRVTLKPAKDPAR